MMLVTFDGHYHRRSTFFLVHVTCRRTFLPPVAGSHASRPARHPAGGYSAVLSGHPVLRVPFSEYYECVRLPLRRKSPSFVLVGLTGATRPAPERIGPLLFLTILSLHTTPVYPGGPFGTSPYLMQKRSRQY